MSEAPWPRSICMFSNLYPPVVSGSSTQSYHLSRELARRGHAVQVITARLDRDQPESEESEGIHLYRLPAWRLPKMGISLNFPWLNATILPGNGRRIRDILHRHQPEVLHSHNHMFDLAFSAATAGQRTGKPVVLTLHTMIRHARRVYNLFLTPADRILLRRLVVDRADGVICPDVNVQVYAREAFGLDQAPIVPYGVSLPETPSSEKVDDLREKYGLRGKKVILSLGHVHEIRNRKDLIEAFPKVLQSRPDAVLLVAGALSTDKPVAWVRSLGLESSVLFAGHVPHGDVPALLALADLEAHWLNQDDADRTSLGIASLEAMSVGKVILTAANENAYGPGILKNGENIVIVATGQPERLAQTILSLLQDDAKRERIGQNAKDTIALHFSWDSICAKTLAVYRDAAERFRKR